MIYAAFTGAQPVNIPLGHRIYDFLERMQTKGVILPQYNTYPYTRSEAAALLVQIQQKIDGQNINLTEAEIDRFEQFKGEFHEDLENQNIPVNAKYKERHFLTWTEDKNRAYADLLFEQKVIKQKGEDAGTISHTTGGGFLRGRLTNHFGFYLFTYSTLRKGEHITEEHFDTSQGSPITLSGKNAYSDDASAYFMLQFPHLNIEFGRDEAQWGPGLQGNLMLSRHEAYFNMLRIGLQYKRFQFTSIHGKLNHTGAPKFLAAHRLELNICPWLHIAGSELVIYGNRDIEPIYLNPLMPYHVAEHHLGDLDNNTMAFDMTVFPMHMHKLYMEFFLDDFTTSENPFTYYGNKWALLAGWHWAEPFGLADWDIEMEYTRIEPYVYTHNDTINIYEEYSRPLGHWLGPNSDDLNVQIGYLANRDLDCRINFDRTRHGNGDLFTPPDASVTKRKHFLSGTVETRWHFGLAMQYQLFKDCFLNIDYTHCWISNYMRQKDIDKTMNQMIIDLLINY